MCYNFLTFSWRFKTRSLYIFNLGGKKNSGMEKRVGIRLWKTTVELVCGLKMFTCGISLIDILQWLFILIWCLRKFIFQIVMFINLNFESGTVGLYNSFKQRKIKWSIYKYLSLQTNKTTRHDFFFLTLKVIWLSQLIFIP